MSWWRRWLRRLQYAHDPEAHRLLLEVLARVDALTKQAHLTVMPVPFPTHPRKLDCGHMDTTVATDGNGRTECGYCNNVRRDTYRRPWPPVQGVRR